jgi:hypothetical protein
VAARAGGALMSWHHASRSINYERFYARRSLLAVAAILLIAGTAQAQLRWVPHGPGPTTFGQVEGITEGQVVGALHDIAPHPTDPDVIYVGGAGGGVWRTSSARTFNPHWEPLTDDQESLSIGALEFDPT